MKTHLSVRAGKQIETCKHVQWLSASEVVFTIPGGRLGFFPQVVLSNPRFRHKVFGRIPYFV